MAATATRPDILEEWMDQIPANKRVCGWSHRANVSLTQRGTVGQVCSYSVCIRVAPDLAVHPGSRHHPVVFVLQPFGPLPAVNGRQQASTRVANVDLGVLAAGGPDHGPAKRIILDVEGELAVVVVDFPDLGALIEVYGQQVPVMCLEV